MTILIKNILSILKILVENTGHRQITFSILFGLGLGLSPLLSIQFFLIISLILIFNVQFSLSLSSAFFFKGIFIFFAPLFNQIGHFVLKNDSLKDFFIYLYDIPLIPFTKFNNTIVMGSFVFYLIIFIPTYFIVLRFIQKYQTKISKKIKASKLYKIIRASFIVKWYEKYDRIYG